MKTSIPIVVLMNLVFQTSFAQQDSTTLFENSKKTLHHPLASFNRLIEYDSVKYSTYGDPIIGNTYYTDKADSVKAIFEGTVVSILEIRGVYGVITKCGKYFMTYYGLNLPLVKKGDVIHKDHLLGILALVLNTSYQLELMISQNDRYLDPMKWIK